MAPATDAADRRIAQLAVLVTSLLGCAEGCRRWCSTRPLSRRLRILFLMLSIISPRPSVVRLPSVRRRAHPYDLADMPEVTVRRDKVRAGLHRVCCDPDVVCRDWSSLRPQRRHDPGVVVCGHRADRHERHVWPVEKGPELREVLLQSRSLPETGQQLAHDAVVVRSVGGWRVSPSGDRPRAGWAMSVPKRPPLICGFARASAHR